MISSPLQQLNLNDNRLDDLTGVETFTRLEGLSAERNQLRDISAVTAVAGLKSLNLRQNDVSDISNISGLTSLETLIVDGNEIATLDSLAGLKQLKILVLGSSVQVLTADGQAPPPPRILDNPIRDARALTSLPTFSNPFVSKDQLSVRFTIFPDTGDAGGAMLDALAAGQDAGTLIEGSAVRVATSTEFTFTPIGGGQSEPIRFMGGIMPNELEPVLWAAVLFPARKKIGIALVPPATPTESLDRTAAAKRISANKIQVLGPALIGFPMEIMVEAKAV